MRIISKYKDYYDGVQSMGFDESLIYIRQENIKTVKKPDSYHTFIQDSLDTLELDRINLETGDYNPKQEHIECNEIEVGFCGKLYPAIAFKHIKDGNEIGKKVLYQSIDIVKYIAELKKKYRKLFFRCSFYNYYLEEPTIQVLEEHFSQRKYERKYESWFQDFQTPIFIFTTNPNQTKLKWNDKKNEDVLHIIENPKLKDLEFFRVKDNFSAYQELSQFIGGVLGNNEINKSELTDIEKIQQHGFDLKYGFRTRPKRKK